MGGLFAGFEAPFHQRLLHGVVEEPLGFGFDDFDGADLAIGFDGDLGLTEPLLTPLLAASAGNSGGTFLMTLGHSQRRQADQQAGKDQGDRTSDAHVVAPAS